jgi:hypothetical protein
MIAAAAGLGGWMQPALRMAATDRCASDRDVTALFGSARVFINVL